MQEAVATPRDRGIKGRNGNCYNLEAQRRGLPHGATVQISGKWALAGCFGCGRGGKGRMWLVLLTRFKCYHGKTLLLLVEKLFLR